jgi:hypothetical protein
MTIRWVPKHHINRATINGQRLVWCHHCHLKTRLSRMRAQYRRKQRGWR